MNRNDIFINGYDLCKFISKIKDTGNCMLWTGGTKNGYGVFYKKGKNLYAHRVAYYIYNKKISNELVIDHMCMNKLCVNPEHLREVTQTINSLENNYGVFAKNKIKTHCKHGHVFDDSNTAIRIRNGRQTRCCKKCMKDKNDQRKYKKNGSDKESPEIS